MKKHLFGLLAMLVLAFGTNTAQAQHQHGKRANWQEMHNFHDVMSVTFHSAEDKNFAPLREKSALLVERAETWKKSAVPEGYKPAETADVLKRLVNQCKKVHKMVKKGKSDDELWTGINTAHDIFHEIMEKCRH